jgi:hypothetical protein
VNSSEKPPPKLPNELEIQTEESTLGRFNDLLGRVLNVSREEVRTKEEEFKKDRRKKRRNATRKTEKE